MNVDAFLSNFTEQVSKAMAAGVSANDWAAATVINVSFEDMVTVWGGVETPLLTRCGVERAVAITDMWRDIEIAAAAENAQIEGTVATALTAVPNTPTKRTNTCQLMMELINVSGSAMEEARRGVFGSAADVADQIAFQASVRLPQMVASLALSSWFNLEVTQASAAEASARQMSGLIGTVGSGGFDDGLLTTTSRATVTDNSGAAFDQDIFDAWLSAIAVAGAGARYRPTAVYCSLTAQQKISQFSSMVNVTVSLNELNNLTAGARVTKYNAPWGAAIDIVWEPQNSHSATAANNWMAALCEPLIKHRPFRGTPSEGGMIVTKLPYVPDLEQACALYEGTIKAEVFKAHGVLHDFSVSL